MTSDGNAGTYVHGEPWDARSSIELIYDSVLIETSEEFELPETDFVLLSEEDVEKEVKELEEKEKKNDEEKEQTDRS